MIRLHTTEFMVTYTEDEDEGYILSAYIFHLKKDIEKLRTFVGLFFPLANVRILRDAYHFPDAHFVTLPPRKPGLPMIKVVPDLTAEGDYILFPEPGRFRDLSIEVYGIYEDQEFLDALEELGISFISDGSFEPEVA